MSKLKKKKSKSYAKLKIALDRVFSLYVRLRFSDGRGIASCASCGLRSPFKALQCGHFVSRSYLATRWHLENCAPQCVQGRCVQGRGVQGCRAYDRSQRGRRSRRTHSCLIGRRRPRHGDQERSRKRRTHHGHRWGRK